MCEESEFDSGLTLSLFPDEDACVVTTDDADSSNINNDSDCIGNDDANRLEDIYNKQNCKEPQP